MFKKISKDHLRLISEIVFLLIFVLLLKNKRMQNWILVFGAGVLISLIFGRLYCAWICPIATLFRPVNWVYSKLGINRLKTPEFMKKGWLRWGLLFLFVVAMAGARIFKIKFNLILYLTLLAVFVTLIFEEKFWHKCICPYGTLLNLTSRPAFYSLRIDGARCTGCGFCQRNCPNNSIITLDSGKRSIINESCLTCFKCQDVCPFDAVEYSGPTEKADLKNKEKYL